MSMGGSGDRGEVTAEINVTPMADVMLVLLIIFMVVTPLLQKSVTVDLVHTKNVTDEPKADRDDAVIVAIMPDGNFFLGPDKTPIEEIGAKVAKLVKERTDKTVYVKSDARAKYGDVVEVVDSIRGSGVDKIGLITEGPARKAEPAPEK